MSALDHNAQRTSFDGTTTTVTRYTAGAVLDGAGAVIQRSVGLPGGATRTDTGGTIAWFYPNLHGDVILQANDSGAREGARSRFDPFGQPINPATGDIGTEAADDAVVDTTPGDADLAFVGGHGKLYEHGGTIATIEMGARQYVAALGRFLEVDPVEGGVSNAYDYPADPINQLDLSGERVAPSDWGGAGFVWAWQIVQNHKSARGPARGSEGPVAPKVQQPHGSAPDSRYSNRPQPIATPQHGLELGVTVCVIIRIELGSVFSDKSHPFFGIGIGPEADVSGHIGYVASPTPGTSYGAGCSAAYYGGVYGDVDWSVPNPNIENGPDYDIGGGWGAGLEIGVGAGCSLGMRWTG